MIDWIIGVAAAIIVVAVIRNFIKSSKSGKSNCGSGCSGCASKDSCNTK